MEEGKSIYLRPEEEAKGEKAASGFRPEKNRVTG
jgi:hypothetical protein